MLGLGLVFIGYPLAPKALVVGIHRDWLANSVTRDSPSVRIMRELAINMLYAYDTLVKPVEAFDNDALSREMSAGESRLRDPQFL